MPGMIARVQLMIMNTLQEIEKAMDILAGKINDPLIAPCGKVYSASGLMRLLNEMFANHVDNRAYICRGMKRRRVDNDSRNNGGKRK